MKTYAFIDASNIIYGARAEGWLFSAVGAAEGNINQSKCNDHESKCNRNISVYFRKAHHSILSSNQKAVSRHNIAPVISVVNINLFEINDRSEKFGNINAAPIQPAAKLVNRPESTFNLGFENNFISLNLAEGNNVSQLEYKKRGRP